MIIHIHFRNLPELEQIIQQNIDVIRVEKLFDKIK